MLFMREFIIFIIFFIFIIPIFTSDLNCEISKCPINLRASNLLGKTVVICDTQNFKEVRIDCKSKIGPIDCSPLNILVSEHVELYYFKKTIAEDIFDKSTYEHLLIVRLKVLDKIGFISKIFCKILNNSSIFEEFIVYSNDRDKNPLVLNVQPYVYYGNLIPCVSKDPLENVTLFKLIEDQKEKIDVTYIYNFGFQLDYDNGVNGSIDFAPGMYLCESGNYSVEWNTSKRFENGLYTYPENKEPLGFVGGQVKLICECEVEFENGNENVSFVYDKLDQDVQVNVTQNFKKFQEVTLKVSGKPRDFYIKCQNCKNRNFTWKISILKRPWWQIIQPENEILCYRESEINTPGHFKNLLYECRLQSTCDYSKCNANPACLKTPAQDISLLNKYTKGYTSNSTSVVTCPIEMNSETKYCEKTQKSNYKKNIPGIFNCIISNVTDTRYFINGLSSGKKYIDMENIPFGEKIIFKNFPNEIILDPVSTKFNDSIVCDALQWYFVDDMKFVVRFLNDTLQHYKVPKFEDAPGLGLVRGQFPISVLVPEIKEIFCFVPVRDLTEMKSISRSIDIRLPLKPEIMEGNLSLFKTFQINSSENFLKCSSKGHPFPKSKISWSHNKYDEIDLTVFELNEEISLNGTMSILNFPKITTMDMGGIYTCITKNDFGTATKSYNVKISNEMENDPSNSSQLYWILFSLFVTILILLIVFIILYKKYTKDKSQTVSKNFKEADIKLEPKNLENTENERKLIPQDFFQYNSYKGLKIPKADLDIDDKKHIGGGHYGNVYSCSYKKGSTVAIKSIKNSQNFEQNEILLEELQILSSIGAHPNIVGLIGACFEDTFYIVVEYCPVGSLLNYLKSNKEIYKNLFNKNANIGYSSILDTKDLIQWASQIADAMIYLEEIKIIHGDLATRNILLFNRLNIKLTDFGLSKKLYNYKFYKLSKEKPLPLPWLAIESMCQGVFSTKSDVWAFGVTLWEMFSLGDTPYGTQSQLPDFNKKILKGLRLKKPENSNNLIFEKMSKCWSKIPDERPNFKELKIFFQNLINKGISPELHDGSENSNRFLNFFRFK